MAGRGRVVRRLLAAVVVAVTAWGAGVGPAAADPPVAPTDLAGTVTNTITVTWTYAGDDGDLVGFRVEAWIDQGSGPAWTPVGSVAPTARSFEAPAPELPVALDVDVRIVAVGAGDVDGPPSAPLTLHLPGRLAPTTEFEAGAPSVVYDHATVTGKTHLGRALDTWVDGTLGILPSTTGTTRFIAANGSRTAITEGTPADPAATLLDLDMEVQGLLSPGSYAAGGPVYVDPVTGDQVLVYHHERQDDAGWQFYSSLGLAVWVPDASAPAGGRFHDLGLVVEPDITYAGWDAFPEETQPWVELGGGAAIVRDEYVYLHFTDHAEDGQAHTGMSVARAPLSAVREAIAERGQPGATPPVFAKMGASGSFTEPGLGGTPAPVFDEPGIAFLDIARDDCRDRYVMTFGIYGDGGATQSGITTSPDGLDWAPAALLYDEGHHERNYNTIVGTSLADPKVITASSFTLLSTSSETGPSNRWSDAEILSTTITDTTSATSGCRTAVPSSPTGVDLDVTEDELVITWTQDDTASPATDFVVEAAVDTGGTLDWMRVGDLASTAPTTSREMRLPRPPFGADLPVRLRVTARNAAGQASAPSAELATTIPAHPDLVLAPTTRFTVTSDVEVASHAAMQDAGGPGVRWFPDGQVARLPRDGGGFHFVAPNGGGVAVTSGTATHPFSLGVDVAWMPIADMVVPGAAAMGGPVVVDPVSGEVFLFYIHHRTVTTSWRYYGSIGVAVWDAASTSFRDLGLVVSPHLSLAAWEASTDPNLAIEVGGGAVRRHGDVIDLYFTDWTSTGGGNGVRVARGSLADLVAAAAERDDPGYEPPAFLKHHGGTFSEPGIEGDSTALAALAHVDARFPDVIWSECTDEVVMTFSTQLPTGAQQTVIATSPDGITWDRPELLYAAPTNERFYGTLLGSAAEAKVAEDGAFDLLTSDSVLGAHDRGTDATLRAVRIEDTACPST